MYYKGYNDREIACQLDVSLSTVSKFRYREGLPRHKSRVDKATFLKYYNIGEPDYIIAKKMKIASSTIRNFRTNEGLNAHYHRGQSRREKEEYKKQLINNTQIKNGSLN